MRHQAPPGRLIRDLLSDLITATMTGTKHAPAAAGGEREQQI